MFEEVVTVGGQQVRVRVVLNPSGALRSVHLRLEVEGMKIEWHLDMGEALDLDNLLGDITLRDAQTCLEERDTYIDSWLVALITGLQAVQAGQSISVDIQKSRLRWSLSL